MDIEGEDTEYRIEEPKREPKPNPEGTPGTKLNETGEIRMQLAQQAVSFLKLKGEKYHA